MAEAKKTAKAVSRDTAIVLALLGFLFLVRVMFLGADPPLHLSGSSDVYTDPPQYTLWAKQLVQQGDLNPLGDTRLPFFLKSTVTVLAVAVFKVLGVGFWQSNLVGLLFSFGGLLFFFLFVRRRAGSLAGIFFLGLIAFNYNQIFYGRLPFLEHAMFFFAALALFLLTYFKKRPAYLLAGMSLAVAIFFGKVIGVVFLFPFACLLIYRFVYEDERARREKILDVAAFVIGFAAVTVFWLFFSYLPMQKQVAGYLGEQAVDLYGAPEGLESFDDFLWKMVSFGVVSNLFPRMIVVALLGVVFICMAAFHVSSGKSWREGFGELNSGHVFMAAMIIAFYGSLMIWNYRPLRYELVLIYPFCAAAAVVLSMLWRESRKPDRRRVPWLFYVLLIPITMVVVTQIYNGLMDRFGGDFAFDDNKYLLGVIAAIVAAWIGAATAIYLKGKIPANRFFRQIIVVLAVGGVIGWGASDYFNWMKRRSYTAQDNSADLSMILSPGAVLSGPYAAHLTLGGNLGTLIHMFGVSEVDTTLFARFPVTHLLLDQANETRARDDHPRLMGGAAHICTYHVGAKKIRLFRVAPYTRNARAFAYERSHFETAVDLYRADSVEAANRYAVEFMRLHPNNISGNLMVAEFARKSKQFDHAEMMFKKAVEFSPTNYNLNATLGQFCIDRFDQTGDSRCRKVGLEYLEEAHRLAPTARKVNETLNKLKGIKDGDG